MIILWYLSQRTIRHSYMQAYQLAVARVALPLGLPLGLAQLKWCRYLPLKYFSSCAASWGYTNWPIGVHATFSLQLWRIGLNINLSSKPVLSTCWMKCFVSVFICSVFYLDSRKTSFLISLPYLPSLSSAAVGERHGMPRPWHPRQEGNLLQGHQTTFRPPAFSLYIVTA